MARIREMWNVAIERLPRPQWSIQGVAMMGALLAVSFGMLWHCTGNAWLFCAGIVVAGQLAGAAFGVPFRRITQGALCGALLGLMFFAYAAIT